VSLLDVTITLDRSLPTYEEEPGPIVARLASVAEGDEATVSSLFLGVHSGTHVDAPVHLIPGAGGVEDLPLEAMIGPAVVVELGASSVIGAEHLANAVPPGTQRLLLKTRNSQLWEKPGFQTDFVGLRPDAARWIVDQGIRLVGIDYLSIEPYGTAGLPAHRTLLQAGVVILEGLDLRWAPSGLVTLHCLPIKLTGADGAPARVVLEVADSGAA
jgi:arylformamidase